MPVTPALSRNQWRSSEQPHIVVADNPPREMAQTLINACPAGLFTLTPLGALQVDYRGCLECGSCRLLCDEKTLVRWGYPEGGFGITLRFG